MKLNISGGYQMKMHDYNRNGDKVVLLLHPMLASGLMMYELLGKKMGEDVRCLAPDFASHGDESDQEYADANTEADAILKYLHDNNISHIDLAYGASLGGIILTELLKHDLSFSTVFFEGTSFFENANTMTKIVSSVFIKKHQRAVNDYDRAVKAMGELYGEQFAVDFAKQFIGMSENSIRNIAKSCGHNVHADLTPAMQKQCIFAYGSKDFNTFKAKGGCKKYYPHAKYIVWEGYGHCEKVVADTDAYVKMLKQYLNK